MVGALLDHIEATFCVDAKRVYSTGMSDGGGMTSVLACKDFDRFAAFGAVAVIVFLPGCGASHPIALTATYANLGVLVTRRREREPHAAERLTVRITRRVVVDERVKQVIVVQRLRRVIGVVDEQVLRLVETRTQGRGLRPLHPWPVA